MARDLERAIMNKLKIPFFNRFATVGGFAFTFVILITHAYYAHRTADVLRQRLDQKAVFISGYLAFPFATSIQNKDDVTLVQIMDQLEKDPDVISAVVVDDRGEIRYSADPNKLGEENLDEDIKKVAETGEPILKRYTNNSGDAMTLVAPLKAQARARPLGIVRLDMTYKNVDEQTARSRDSFTFYAFGIFLFALSMTLSALRAWVSKPLAMLKNYLRTVSPLSAEASLPEGLDDLGQLNAAVNALILKFRSEIQNQVLAAAGQVTQEAELISQTLRGILPESRILMANRENIFISDSATEGNVLGQHVLDFASDPAFAPIVGTAFQQEGTPSRGTIVWNNESVHVTVLQLSDLISQGVKTLIVINKESKPV